MRRRQFVARLPGVLMVWPLAVRAGQADRVRRIGVLLGWAEDDPEAQQRFAAFKRALAALGWSENRNVILDVRWTGADLKRASALAKELVGPKPDIILATTTPSTAAVQRETRTIPTVFVAVADPVGSGFVKTLARPGGNITGFLNIEASVAQKWIQLLKEVAPHLKRVAVMFNPKTAPYAEYYLEPINATPSMLGLNSFPTRVSNEVEIERIIADLGRRPDSALLIMNDSFMLVHRKPVIALAARYNVPAMYPFSAPYVEDGGLIGYGVDTLELFRRAASYVDRILRGAKAGDLPVEQPTKFELVINLKTAKALGIKIPQSILARADHVIE